MSHMPPPSAQPACGLCQRYARPSTMGSEIPPRLP